MYKATAKNAEEQYSFICKPEPVITNILHSLIVKGNQIPDL